MASKRKDFDFYETPPWTTHAFLDAFGPLPEGRLLEPAAGEGALIRVLRERGFRGEIHAVDVDGQHASTLERCADRVFCPVDFLMFPPGLDRPYDLVVANPPFGQALDFVERALQICRPGGLVVMLLRLAFLEGQGRLEFHQHSRADKAFVLSRRPSFENNKRTDRYALSWFCWVKGEKPEWTRTRVI